jgi:parallel beta-helix repeat protein
MLFVPINSAYSNIGIQIDNKQIIISNKGNTLYVGGNGSNNYSTIQSAINDANNGDTVFVYDDSSPYKENLIINKSINLIGENRDDTIIDGNNNDSVIKIKANYVTISNFTIQNGKGVFNAGIELCFSHNPTNYTTIFNNNIFNNEEGIYIRGGSSYNNISDNNISYNEGNGILNWGGSDPYRNFGNIIQGNIISYNGYRGIDSTTNVYKTIIIDNKIFSNDGGGIFSDGSYDEICYNKIYSNKIYGINYGLGFPSLNVLISNNKIYKNLGYGIFLYGFIWGCLVNFEISNNHIESNLLIGIQLRWTEMSKIINNNIFNNVLNARFSNSFGNKWDGNYWGSSKNIKIISGSIKPFDWYPLFNPFITFPIFNFDFHPAKEPYDI